jgi:VWFA-related protein
VELTPRARVVAAVCALLTLAATRIQQPSGTPAPDAEKRVEILSPGPDAYVSGATLLRARVVPPNTATLVVFFVDGRQVCALTKPPYECEWDAGISVAEHQVRVAVTLTGGTRAFQSVRTRGVGFSEKVDVDAVQVTVTVLDGHGHFVRSLPKSAFHVAEDGRNQSITHFASEDVPLELVVAVDISGSMTAAMPKLRKAVKEFLAAVPPTDRVTLLGFNDTIFPLTRRTTDPAERVKAVDRLAAWGTTALYDVILHGVDLLGRQTGRKALIVFTDGEDQGSHAVIHDVEQKLEASDVTLYMIGQGRGVKVEGLKRIMQGLSLPTGGRALFTDSIDELHGAFNELLDELSNQYLLGYAPPNTVRDNSWRKIKVSVDGYHEVRARQGYRATAAK